MIRQYIIYTILVLLVFSSCRDNFFDSIIDVEVSEHEPQLTVTAHLFNGNPQQRIHVNHSTGILESTSIQPVKDAIINLYEGDNLLSNFSFWEDDRREGLGVYLTDSLSFISGRTYTLKVQSNQYGTIESTQVMPSKVAIKTATFEEDGAIDRYGDRADEISIQFDDPKDQQNYYSISVRGIYEFANTDTSFIVDNIGLQVTPVDPFLEEAWDVLLLSDASFDGKTYTLNFGAFTQEVYYLDLEGQLIGLKIGLSSVSKDFYSFWKSMDTYENNEDNFFAEPVNVYENVEGGIGIFTLNNNEEFLLEF